MNETLKTKSLNRAIENLLRSSWLIILFIVLISFMTVIQLQFTSINQQMDLWHNLFRTNMEQLEESLSGDGSAASLKPYLSRFTVDQEGLIIRSDPEELVNLNISNSGVYNRFEDLRDGEILIFFYPDLRGGQNTVYFIKKSGSEFSIFTYKPELFFPESIENVIIQIKDSRLVLYSTVMEYNGEIAPSPLIRVRLSRIYLARQTPLENTGGLVLYLSMDITAVALSLMIVLILLCLFLYIYIGHSRILVGRLKILNSEQISLVEMIREIAATAGVDADSLDSRLNEMIYTFRLLKDQTRRVDYRFEEIREYSAVLYSFLNDISVLMEKVQTDARSLGEMESYLSNVINSMPSLILVLDSRGRITQWNREAEAVTGISSDKALGLTLDETLPWLTDKKNYIEKSLETREKQIFPQQKRVVDNQVIHENITIFPLTQNGVSGVVIRIDDVTHTVRLMEDLIQSQKMDAIGQLAGGVAHDFNNMLGGIMGAMEIIRLHCDDNEEITEYLDVVMEATERASALARDLLAFARKRPIGSTAIDIHKIIGSTMAILSKTIDRRIHIIQELNAVHSWVVGEETQLQNIIMNLAINASHAMPEGGELNIFTENVLLTSTDCEMSAFDLKPGNHISLHVRDTGSGMSREVLDKIFEPFFTTKGPGKGTGMGLSAVHGTIIRHGGSITVYSEIGMGTSFHILLPLSEKEGHTEHVDREPLIHGRGTVLLVDDELVMLKTGQALLREMGYTVLTAPNGRVALEEFNRNRDRIDLVILDMVMPVMNGYECFRELRKLDPDLLIVISSGFSREEELEEIKASGLSGFIAKPFRGIELSRLIHRLLGSNSRP